MEVHLEFLFSWPLFHSVSWETDEKFSFWLNTHTTIQSQPYWRLEDHEKRSHIQHMSSGRASHSTCSLSLNTLWPFFVHHLHWGGFLTTFLMSYPAPSPHSHPLGFLDRRLNSSPQLFLHECRVVPPLQVLPPHAQRWQTYTTASQVQGPIPSWQCGCTHHCPITQYTFSPKFGCFLIISKTFCLFLPETIQYFCSL